MIWPSAHIADVDITREVGIAYPHADASRLDGGDPQRRRVHPLKVDADRDCRLRRMAADLFDQQPGGSQQLSICSGSRHVQVFS